MGIAIVGVWHAKPVLPPPFRFAPRIFDQGKPRLWRSLQSLNTLYVDRQLSASPGLIGRLRTQETIDNYVS